MATIVEITSIEEYAVPTPTSPRSSPTGGGAGGSGSGSGGAADEDARDESSQQAVGAGGGGGYSSSPRPLSLCSESPSVIQQQQQPFAVDAFGFYLTADDQIQAPFETTESEAEMMKKEEGWWLAAVKNWRRIEQTINKYRNGEYSPNGVCRSGSLYSCITPTEVKKDHNDANDGEAVGGKTAATMSGQPQQQPMGSRSGGCCSTERRCPALQRDTLREMRHRIRRGLEFSTTRRIVWPFLMGALDAPSDRYSEYLKGSVPFEMNEVIIRDLPRTFPTHCLFVNQNSHGQGALHRVLSAYCNLDPDVGYCQGMGFLVAILLLHLPEEASFWTFAQMMQGKKYDMRRLFLPGFPLLQQFFVILRGAVRDLLPKLFYHLEEQNVDVSFFASQWFLTLFAYQFPIPVACRMWDLFFSEGWRFIFQVTLALLQWDCDKLVTMRMEGVLMHLKTIHEGKPVAELIQRALEVPFEDLDLHVDVAPY